MTKVQQEQLNEAELTKEKLNAKIAKSKQKKAALRQELQEK